MYKCNYSHFCMKRYISKITIRISIYIIKQEIKIRLKVLLLYFSMIFAVTEGGD